MSRVQADNVHDLLRQHLDALELAMNLGLCLEQKLASSRTLSSFHTTGLPTQQEQPPVQTAATRRMSYATRSMSYEFTSKGIEGEPEVSSESSSWTGQILGIVWPFRTQPLQEPLLPAQPKLEGIQPRPVHSSPSENPVSCSNLAAIPSLADLDRKMAREMTELEHLVKQDTGWSISDGKKLSEKDKFKSKGLAQRIRRSRAFNIMCFIAILGNAIWVYLDVNVDETQGVLSSLIVQVLGNTVCGWYLIELVIWLLAFKRACDAFTVGWFDLHAIIVGLMVWSVWVEPLAFPGYLHAQRMKDLSFFQVFRLARIARAAGISSTNFNSKAWVKGIFVGIESIVPLLILLSMIVYAFANTLKWLLSHDVALGEHFATVPKAFHFLFLCSLSSVDKNLFDAMLDAGWCPWFLFVVFTLFGNLIMAKMMTGILLQVVVKLIKGEQEKSDTAHLEQKIVEVATKLDNDEDGMLSRQEFEALMHNKELLLSMAKHDMDVARFINFILVSFSSNGQLSVADLIRSANRFCGFKEASVKDIMTLRKLLYMEIDVIMAGQERLLEAIQAPR